MSAAQKLEREQAALAKIVETIKADELNGFQADLAAFCLGEIQPFIPKAMWN